MTHASGISSLPLVSPHPFASLRGGVSESAASWSAGSRYNDYRSGSRQSLSQNYKNPSDYTVDPKAKAKEAFAEAFLRREDRNRFIGELRSIDRMSHDIFFV